MITYLTRGITHLLPPRCQLSYRRTSFAISLSDRYSTSGGPSIINAYYPFWNLSAALFVILLLINHPIKALFHVLFSDKILLFYVLLFIFTSLNLFSQPWSFRDFQQKLLRNHLWIVFTKIIKGTPNTVVRLLAARRSPQLEIKIFTEACVKHTLTKR